MIEGLFYEIINEGSETYETRLGPDRLPSEWVPSDEVLLTANDGRWRTPIRGC